MTCPTIDKLSQYADDLLTGEEHVEIRTHIETCGECQRVAEVFRGEQQFIKETLKTPTLPDDFTNLVLDQLEPYEQKMKRRNPWKRVMLAVAGVTLAVGLSAALNPSFAEWIGGLFATEKVDEGLRIATDVGLAERVNLEVMDKGMTFKVEDVIADSSRVALSYQIVNKNGKAQEINQEIADLESEILVTDQNGKLLDDLGMQWQSIGDYGLFEFSLRDQDALEKITVHFNIAEINGVKGNWKLEVPVELKENNELTTTFSLDGVKTGAHGVKVNLKEVQFAPSSNELFYETSFTDEAREEIEREILLLEKNYGTEIVHGFTDYGSEIQYHIENEKKEAVFYHNSFLEGMRRTSDFGLLQGTGRPLGQIGDTAWNESFIPQQDGEKLNFVLDGVIKTVPANFSVMIKQKELKKQPISFEHEGNFVKITKVEKQSDYYLRKALLPIGKRTSLTIEMEGEKEVLSPELGAWALVDEQGNSYLAYGSGSILKKTLTVYELDKIPEEFTLHLLSITYFEEVQEKWKIPLY